MKSIFIQNRALRFFVHAITGCLFLLGIVTEARAVVITVPSVPGTDTTSLTPVNRRLANSAARFIYTASEVGATGNITGMGFQKAYGATSINVNYVQIYMRETSSSTISTSAVSYTSSPYVQVYDGPIVNTMDTGWTMVTFNKSPFLFSYSGGSNNLEVVIVKGSESATTSYPVYTCNLTLGASTAYYLNASTGFSTTTSFTATTTRRPNIRLVVDNACSGKPAAGSVSGPATAVCPATNFTLTGSGVTIASGIHYQWQMRNTGSGPYLDLLNDTFGTLTTSITASKEFRLMTTCVFSAQYDSTPAFNVNVLAKPSIAASSDTTFCAGGSVLLTTSTVTGVTYTWFKDGSTTGATGGSYTATATGVYTVVASTTACSGVSSITKTVTVNPLPTATVTPSGATTFCDGDSVVLSVATGTGWTYQWQRGTSDLPGASSANFSAKTTGNYRVRVTAPTGCYIYATYTAVTVNPSPAPFTINGAGGATSFCALSSLTLSTTSISGLSYQWRSSAGDISGATTASYGVTIPETYTLVATLGACSRSSNSIAVVEHALPMATITPSGAVSFCAGDSLKAEANSGTGLTYEWQESGSAIAGVPSSATTYWIKTNGIYTVKVTATATGCSNVSPSLTISLISPSTPTVAAASADTFCDGGSVKLNAVVASGLLIQWMDGNLLIPGETGTSYTTTASGDFRIRVTNGVGCAAFSNTQYVRVNPNPSNSISLSGSTSNICDGETARLIAAMGTGYTYQWQESGVDIPGATHNPFYATAAGSYTARIIDANGCTDTTGSIAITVKYVSPFYISPDGNTFFCDGGSVKLSTQTGFSDYQWLHNGIEIPGATTTFVVADKNGKYAIRLKDPGNGCTATSPGFNIRVIATPDSPVITRVGNRLSTAIRDVRYQWYWNSVAIPGATDSFIIAAKTGDYMVEVTNFSDCSRSSELNVSSLGINDPSAIAAMVKVYPNPAQDKLNIEAPAGSQVLLNDLQGRTLYRQSGTAPIDMTPYAAGMYLVIITDNDNQTIGVERISKAAY